jgi:hypothetical protein
LQLIDILPSEIPRIIGFAHDEEGILDRPEILNEPRLFFLPAQLHYADEATMELIRRHSAALHCQMRDEQDSKYGRLANVI